MDRDQAASPETTGASMGRRALLRYGAGIALAAPLAGMAVVGVASSGDQRSAAAAQPTPVATSGPTAASSASPAASPAGSPSPAITVKMTTRLRFEPAEITIKVGETIRWINESPLPHTTTGDPEKNPVKKTHPDYGQLPPDAEPWDSGLLNPGQSFAHTFTTPGEYNYFCIPHILSGMRGLVTVADETESPRRAVAGENDQC